MTPLFSNIRWVLVGSFVEKTVTFCRFFIIAYFLSPAELGVVALFLLIVTVSEALAKMGFEEAVLRTDYGYFAALNNLFWIRIIRAMLVAGVTTIYYVFFFDTPLITGHSWDLPVLIAFGYFMKAGTSLGIDFFEKQQAFSKLTKFNVTYAFINLFATVSCLLMEASIIAIFYAYALAEFLRMLLSYIYAPIAPKLSFDTVHFKKTLSFSAWLFSSTLLSVVSMHGDKMYIAAIFDEETLGIYYFAFTIISSLSTRVIKPVTRVFRSYYCAIKRDVHRIRTMVYGSISTILLGGVMAAIIALYAGEFLIGMVFGSKWIAATPLLPLIIIWQMMLSASSFITPAFVALGQSRTIFGYQIVYIFSVVLLIIVQGIWLEVEQLIQTYSAAAVVGLTYYLTFMHRAVKSRLRSASLGAVD